MRRAWVVGRLVLTTVEQGLARTWVDRCWTTTADGRRGAGVAISLRPWRRNRWGEYLPGRALVLAVLR